MIKSTDSHLRRDENNSMRKIKFLDFPQGGELVFIINFGHYLIKSKIKLLVSSKNNLSIYKIMAVAFTKGFSKWEGDVTAENKF